MTIDRNYTGNAPVQIGVVKGRVHFELPAGINWVAMDPNNARLMGEELARRAFEAHTGRAPDANKSLLVDQIREKMVNRVLMVLTSLENQKVPMLRRAQTVVDIVLQEAT